MRPGKEYEEEIKRKRKEYIDGANNFYDLEAYEQALFFYKDATKQIDRLESEDAKNIDEGCLGIILCHNALESDPIEDLNEALEFSLLNLEEINEMIEDIKQIFISEINHGKERQQLSDEKLRAYRKFAYFLGSKLNLQNDIGIEEYFSQLNIGGMKESANEDDIQQTYPVTPMPKPRPESAAFEIGEEYDLTKYWSGDSGDEGLGKFEQVQRHHFSYYGGNKEGNILYVPSSSSTRPETSKKLDGQGDHVIPFAFLTYSIMSMLEGSYIKRVDDNIQHMINIILLKRHYLQEDGDIKIKYDQLKRTLDNLSEKIDSYRKVRKDSTFALRQISEDLAEQSKISLRESNRRHLREDLETITSDLIELLNIDPQASLPKKRQEYAKVNFAVAKGSHISSALNSLIDFNNLLLKKFNLTQDCLTEKGTSGISLGKSLYNLSPSPERDKAYEGRSKTQREELCNRLINYQKKPQPELTDDVKGTLINSLFNLIDYPRTGVEKNDDVDFLCNTMARVFVMSFSVFKGLQNFKKEDKISIYNGFIDKVLEGQGWLNAKHKDPKDVLVVFYQSKHGNKPKVTVNNVIQKLKNKCYIDKTTEYASQTLIDEFKKIGWVSQEYTGEGKDVCSLLKENGFDSSITSSYQIMKDNKLVPISSDFIKEKIKTIALIDFEKNSFSMELPEVNQGNDIQDNQDIQRDRSPSGSLSDSEATPIKPKRERSISE